MTYDKLKKKTADAARWQRIKDEVNARRKAQRIANKPPTRDGIPSRDELRQCIEQGYCWWCRRGGWRRLAQHTAMVHQIYANDIREIAVMLKRKATSLKEESEIMSDNRRRAMSLGHAQPPDWRLGQGVKHEFSEAGLISMRANQQHMIESISPETKARVAQLTKERFSKPHLCPVCGTFIPHSTPLYCSEDCRRQVWSNVGRRVGLSLPHEHFLKMGDIIRDKYSKAHRCRVCGNLIQKSRPRAYCSPECAHNPFNLPIHEITRRYLAGESSVELAKVYGCCDHTIRRQLRKSGISIRAGSSHDGRS